MTLCFCGREARGFAWHDFSKPAFERPSPTQCCSVQCLEIASNRKGDMKLSIDEQKAVRAASNKAGEYLERIGKTDLATMTEQEWMGFLAHVYGSVCNEVREIWRNEVPF